MQTRRQYLLKLGFLLAVLSSALFLVVPAVLATPPTIEAHTTVALTSDDPGNVSATVEYDIPEDEIGQLTFAPPDTDVITIEETENLKETDDGYRWTGSDSPKIAYTLSLPEDRFHHDGYGVDAGPWAMIKHVNFEISGDSIGISPDIETTATVEGDGYAGEKYIFLGAYHSTTEKIAGRNITIVSPAARPPAADTDEIFDAYRLTAEHVWIRDDYNESLLISAPTRKPNDHSGRASESEMYVRGSHTLDGGSSTWVHEYIHTGQKADMATDMEWFTEATAQYFSTKIGLNSGHLTVDFYMDVVVTERYEDDVLTEPSTWNSSSTQYKKGQHVLAGLDAQIQAETDGEKSLEDVYASVQTLSGKVTYRSFRTMLLEIAGPQTVEWANTYIDGDGLPDVPAEEAFYHYEESDNHSQNQE